jgi:hypothetical protein
MCETCGLIQSKMKRCARCLSVKYCSSACQLSHWPIHKLHCRVNRLKLPTQEKDLRRLYGSYMDVAPLDRSPCVRSFIEMRDKLVKDYVFWSSISEKMTGTKLDWFITHAKLNSWDRMQAHEIEISPRLIQQERAIFLLKYPQFQ